MDDLASTFTHLGGVGAGQVTKMVNQILVLNNYCVLAEALALAEAAGIDASKIPDALASGYAGSNLLKAVFPRMIARDFEPAGYARQILKDLDLIPSLNRAQNSSHSLPSVPVLAVSRGLVATCNGVCPSVLRPVVEMLCTRASLADSTCCICPWPAA